MQRPNGSGRNQAHAAALGGALSIIIVSILANGLNWQIDPLTSSAITIVMAYVAAFFPKPPSSD